MKYILLALLLTACAHVEKDMNKLSVGMTEAEVKRVMGEPTSLKAKGSERVLVYWERGTNYWVVLNNDHVNYFGEAGDYDSAQPKKIQLQIKH